MTKLSTSKYLMEKDWRKWLKATPGVDLENVNVILLMRAAAYFRDTEKKAVTIGAGFRSIKKQGALYTAWIKYRTWLATKKGVAPPVANLAAAPGTSWHEFGLAIDVNGLKGQYPGKMNEDYTMYRVDPNKCVMKLYGLIQPVNGELWHIQPIETKGYVGDRSKFLT